MAFQLLPKDVGEAFVRQYYMILNRSPENIHKFYHESSFMGWPDPDGDITPVTTLDGINEKVMSSDYKYCSADVITVDAQDSSDGGFLVAVSGYLTTQSKETKSFNQIFFIARQEKGFYVLNDILRCSDLVEIVIDNGADDGDKNEECAISLETLEKPEPAASVACEAAPESPDSDFPLIKDTPAKNASTGSLEKEKPVEPASVIKVETPKITYASVVGKVAHAPSPKASRAASDVPNQASALKKSYSSIVGGATKGSVTSYSMSKAFISPTKEATASQTAKNASSNPSAKAEAKGIYIGGLPYDITKQGIVDVVKKFGPVKNNADTIQIRKHEDGFCCGFVEFETADAARRAVAAHYVMFGEKEAYVTYKRSTYSRNNDGRGKSPPKRSGSRDDGEKDRRGGNNKIQVRDHQNPRGSNRRNRVTGDRW